MAKSKKETGCVSANIKFCGEAMKLIRNRQAEALINTQSKISIETAVNKILLDVAKQKI